MMASAPPPPAISSCRGSAPLSGSEVGSGALQFFLIEGLAHLALGTTESFHLPFERLPIKAILFLLHPDLGIKRSA